VAADRHVRPTRRECLQLRAEIDDRINVSFCRHRSASVREVFFKSPQLIERFGRKLDAPIQARARFFQFGTYLVG
jgi:hypothetical protein